MYKIEDSYFETFKNSSFVALIIAFVMANISFEWSSNFFIRFVLWLSVLLVIGVPLILAAIFLKNRDLDKGLRIDEKGLYFKKRMNVLPWSKIQSELSCKESFIGNEFFLKINSETENFTVQISGYNQKSLTTLIKNLAPPDHSLRECVEKYESATRKIAKSSN